MQVSDRYWRRGLVLLVAALILMAVCPPSASADSLLPIPPGLHTLQDFPNGPAAPLQYGLELDELFNATNGHDVFTFDFDNPQSAMFLNYDPSAETIHIFGHSFGGREIGNQYADDLYAGVYTIDFTYNVGVQPDDKDKGGYRDILVTAPDHRNFGYIIAPASAGGVTIGLTDSSHGDPKSTFELGDQNGEGHQGYEGISGWGDLDVCTFGDCEDTVQAHTNKSQFLFVDPPVSTPEPAGLILLGTVMLAIAAVFRRRSALQPPPATSSVPTAQRGVVLEFPRSSR